MADKVINAASYERVSSDEQAKEGFSLEVQNEKNIAYIKAQNWNFVGSYIDPGKSAKSLKRPDMRRLLNDIDKGVVNVVVVHKLDRLTRNVGDLHYLLNIFEKQEIKLVSITENIDTTSAMGRMFVYMLGIFAQWYRENLSEEVIKGQEKRAKKGLRNTSTRPFGYAVDSEDLSLTVIPEEAKVIRQIFDWFITSGYGRIKIAKLLNTTGVDGCPVSARGGGKWYESYITTVLENPTYIGATHWKLRKADESERIIVEDVHEPIISKEVFDTAQRYLKRRNEQHMSTSSYEFPFSTILKCGECGRSYHGKMKTYKNRPPGRTYRCSGKYRVNSCVHGKDISESKLVPLFLEFLNDFNFSVPDPNKTINSKDVERDRRRIIKNLNDSAEKRKNYTRAMGSGKIDYATFEELIDEENKKVKEWQAQLDALESYRPTTRTKKDIEAYINDLRTNWNGMSLTKQKMMVQKVFEVLVIKNYGSEWKITGFKLAD